MKTFDVFQSRTLQEGLHACSIILLLALLYKEFLLRKKAFLNSTAPSGGLKENA